MGLLETLALLVIVLYGVAPLLIYFTQRSKANPHIEWLDFFRLPSEVQAYFNAQGATLQTLGFVPIASLTMGNAVANVVPVFTLFVNRITNERATVTAIFVTVSGQNRISSKSFEFTSRYADGHIINTSNVKSPPTFQRRPEHPHRRFPSIEDPRLLYQVHRSLAGKMLPQSLAEPWPEQRTIERMGEILREDYEEQVKFGRMVRQGDEYRPTLKGAYLMTWPLLWPIKPIQAWQRDRAAQKLLRELEVTPARPG